MKRTDALHSMLPCDRYTPYSLAKKLGARAVLESATNDNGRGRYSVILVDQAFRVVQDDEGPAFIIEGKRKKAAFKNNVRTVPYRNGVTFEKDILDVLEYIASQNSLEFGEIPLPAAGIGYLGYEFCARCDMIQLAEQEDPLDVPEAMFIVGHLYVIFDHVTQQLHLFALNYNEHTINLEAAMDDLQKKITNMDFSYLEPEPELEPCRIVTNMVQSAVDYISAVNRIKYEIVEGNLLQAVPSRRVLIESKMTALSLYRRLRSENPSPYLFYLDFDNFHLFQKEGKCKSEGIKRVQEDRNKAKKAIMEHFNCSEQDLLKKNISRTSSRVLQIPTERFESSTSTPLVPFQTCRQTAIFIAKQRTFLKRTPNLKV